MSFGLDYISGPPIAVLKEARVDGNPVAFVCRYLSFVNDQTQRKLLSPGEAKTLSQAGVSIVSNYEWYATRALEGESSGVVDAHIAAGQHLHCGGPADRPIYFSVDRDVAGEQVAGYFQGIASAIGLHRTGAYGSYRVLKYLFDVGAIAWGWQTYAWSYGAWESRAHIQQYQNSMSMAGHSVDYNKSIKNDFGQWRTEIMIDIHTPSVADYFTAQPDGAWVSKHTGKHIHGGILAFYQSFGNSALCGLTYLGLPQSNEVPLQGVAGAVRQHFERGVLFYDPSHQLDRPPGSGDVYLAHLYSGPGQDPRVVQLTSQVDTLTQQLAQPPVAPIVPSIPPEVQQKLDHLSENMKQINLLSVAMP